MARHEDAQEGNANGTDDERKDDCHERLGDGPSDGDDGTRNRRPGFAEDPPGSPGDHPQPAHASASLSVAACSRPPVAISKPTSLLSAVRPSSTATIRPRYMTAIRSAISMTSSSSADTRRTAVPASRLTTIWRWMNSTLPTSKPRVG